jgi:hypothetical protein
MLQGSHRGEKPCGNIQRSDELGTREAVGKLAEAVDQVRAATMSCCLALDLRPCTAPGFDLGRPLKDLDLGGPGATQ